MVLDLEWIQALSTAYILHLYGQGHGVMGSREDPMTAHRISFVQVLLFASTSDVVRALNDRLHPLQTSITRRTDLSGVEILGREFDEPVGAFVQQQFSVPAAGPNRFAFPLDINKIIVNQNCALSEFG